MQDASKRSGRPMQHWRIFIAIGISLLLIAASLPFIRNAVLRMQLNAAQQRWEQMEITSYRIQVFYAPYSGLTCRKTAEIRNDVSTIIEFEGYRGLDDPPTPEPITMASVFNDRRGVTRRADRLSNLAIEGRVNLSYDEQFAFPRQACVEFHPRPIDPLGWPVGFELNGSCITVEAFEVLP